MSTRYWIGGSGAWSTASHWSATSGGATDNTLPTSADDVHFDAGSNTSNAAYTVTVDATANCKDLMFDAKPGDGLGGTITLAGSGAVICYGSLKLLAGMNVGSSASTLFLSATSTGKTITSNGVIWNASFRAVGVGGGWTLQDALAVTPSQYFVHQAGTFDTNNQAVSANMDNNGSTARTLTLGTTVWTVPNTEWSVTGSNLTLNAASSTINCGSNWFRGNGLTYGTVNITNASMAAYGISGANTFGTLNIVGPASKTTTITVYANQTITGTFKYKGNSATNRLLIQSDTLGTPRTITAAAIDTASDFTDFMDINAGILAALSPVDTAPSYVLSSNNQIATHNVGAFTSVRSTTGKAAGKWYWECKLSTVVTQPFGYFGVANISYPVTVDPATSINAWVFETYAGDLYHNNVRTDPWGSQCGLNVVVGMALDMDAGTLTIYRNGVLIGVAFTGLTGTLYPIVCTYYSGSAITCNFGATAFAYTPPAGHVALTTAQDPFATGTSIGNALGNSGITFTPSADQHWLNTNGGDWSLNTNWTSRVPLPQDDVFMDCAFNASKTVTTDMPRLGRNISWTGATYTTALTWNTNNGYTLFGSMTLIPAMTLLSGGMVFQGRSTHTLTSAGNSFQGNHVIRCGSYSLADAWTTTGGMTIYGGATFNTAGYTCTALQIWNLGAGAALTLGASSVVLTGSSFPWSFSGTLNAGTSSIKLTNAASATKVFDGYGQTFNNLWLSGAGSGSFNFTGSNTFNDIKVDNLPKSLKFTAGTTTTAASWTGFEGVNANDIKISSITAATHTLAKSGGGVVKMRKSAISYSIASPGSTFYAGAGSTDDGNNTGWTWNNAPATADAAFTGGPDTLVSTAVVAISASSATVSGNIVLSATGAVAIAAGAALVAADSTASAAGTAAISAVSTLTAADDTVWSAGTVAISAVAAITAGDSALAATGAVLITAASATLDADDTISATGVRWQRVSDPRYVITRPASMATAALGARNFTASET